MKDVNELDEKKLLRGLDKIELAIREVKDDYLEEFEDEDPIASIKGELSLLIEQYWDAKASIEAHLREYREGS